MCVCLTRVALAVQVSVALALVGSGGRGLLCVGKTVSGGVEKKRRRVWVKKRGLSWMEKKAPSDHPCVRHTDVVGNRRDDAPSAMWMTSSRRSTVAVGGDAAACALREIVSSQPNNKLRASGQRPVISRQ